VAELCVSLPDCPGGADVSFEIKSTVPSSQPWTEEDSHGAKALDWADELRKADLQAGVTDGKTNRRTGWSPTGGISGRSSFNQTYPIHDKSEGEDISRESLSHSHRLLLRRSLFMH
jgi:hypothetical protein